MVGATVRLRMTMDIMEVAETVHRRGPGRSMVMGGTKGEIGGIFGDLNFPLWFGSRCAAGVHATEQVGVHHSVVYAVTTGI